MWGKHESGTKKPRISAQRMQHGGSRFFKNVSFAPAQLCPPVLCPLPRPYQPQLPEKWAWEPELPSLREPADGYTLLLCSVVNATNAAFYDKLNFDFIRDIAPVATLTPSPTSWW